jgi:[ribosomal protein S5]-alanine N-acetyltransferase
MLTHTGTRTIRTERLVLRRFTSGDAPAFFTNWAGDEEATRFLRFEPLGSIEASRAFLQAAVERYSEPARYYWAIETMGGELIGAIGAFTDDLDLKADISYVIGRGFRGKGYATEAARAVIRHMFLEVGVNRIEACPSVNNPASGRVLTRAGLKLEGRARQKYKCRMGFQDCDLYGLVRDDYEG